MAEERFRDRLSHAFNVLLNADAFPRGSQTYGSAYANRPDRIVGASSVERSILNSVLARMAMDVASASIRHVRVDDSNRYVADIDSGLNSCLNLQANIDQAADHFKRDMALKMFNLGAIAVVPIVTSVNPKESGSYDVNDMRVAQIVNWFPRHVMVNIFNDTTGKFQQITLPKSMVAIIENPLFSVMNEPNSTLQRLIRKLNLLDAVDEASSSGKLDLIIQLPYVIRHETKRQQAQERAKEITDQLKNSTYGVAYTDGTEKITQLNRPADNNLMGQIEYLTSLFYSQMGITPEIMNGTADEATMLNYYTRTINPILNAITQGFKRTFLTKTGRAQLQSIMYFRNPFDLVPTSQMAAIVDKFTRNEVASSNEMRAIFGWKPSSDPNANKLLNKNIAQPPGFSGNPPPKDIGDLTPPEPRQIEPPKAP